MGFASGLLAVLVQVGAYYRIRQGEWRFWGRFSGKQEIAGARSASSGS